MARPREDSLLESMARDNILDNIAENGYVLIPGFLSQRKCDEWLQIMLARDAGEPDGTNYSEEHRLHFVGRRVEEARIGADMLTDETLLGAIREALGPGAWISSVACNANAPGSQAQPMHVDQPPRIPSPHAKRYKCAGPPLEIIASLYLTETDESNGSLEVMPKTHCLSGVEVDSETLAVPVHDAPQPPVRCNGCAGTLILRDKRIWHRGTQNSTAATRFMLTATFCSPSLGSAARRIAVHARLIESLQEARVPT
eukprot:CAMPEP_0175899536 /NCGR_PEP_ID=MMETSP0108-20121206/1853_1 /TAXON_ID=195067 ORGANISM="Goniomonas pacifica, Strain CCMP1869" /NCGR_SAMPLE_ID=MMETSP0108 /ASSEMBLY_ACC=CAM_ASM_000204 /LENGTH=255 /DNA_ID=CAMNT_0017221003 /DNA_START=6 /DNA_END=769 /DNA_ORIENTATION=+